MILNSGPMVQFILFLLLSLSVVSWAIVFTKYTYFKKAQKESNRFIDVFWKSSDLTSVLKEAKNMRFSPVARTFRVGYREWARSYKVTSKKSSSDIGSGIPARQTKNVTVNNVNRALKRSVNVELTRLNRLLAFLATTGNTAPFIGLFGTVWGIMNAFRSIGIKGSASLAVVAPGISEALIATAAGLAAAIPAVVAYNYYLNKVTVLTLDMENFSSEFLNIIERHVLGK